MRKFLLDRGVYRPAETPDDEKKEGITSLDLHVRASGAVAAGWLVKRFRGTIHKQGKFRVHVPTGQQPTWATVAIETLRRRPKRWKVEQWVASGTRYTIVTWKQWGDFAGVRRRLALATKEAPT